MDLDLSGALDDLDDEHEKAQEWQSAGGRENKAKAGGSESTFGPLYFDIETIPDFSRQELFGFDPLPEEVPPTPDEEMVTPEQFVSQSLSEMKAMLKTKDPSDGWIADAKEAENATGKKPRKGVVDLLDDVVARRGALEQAIDARNKTMSVTPEFCRVVAIGVAIGGEEPIAFDEINHRNETEMLRMFWSIIKKHRGPLVGYNVLGFDLPVIFTRSALLGVQPTRQLDLRPWGKDVIDLMKCRYPSGKASRLKDLAQWLGLDVPAEDVDGSQVLDLYWTEPAKVSEYVKSDVAVTRDLHSMWQGYFCS